MAQQRLHRTLIIQTAIHFVDHYGLEALTMRRLGAELGVEAMALYRHVAGREDLLEAITTHLVDQLLNDSLQDAPSASWEDYLRRSAHSTRRLAETHPRLFPLIATRPSRAPWLRPPLRSVEWVESFLENLKRFGFSDEEAVSAYKAFTSFLVGALLLQTLPLTLHIQNDEGNAPRTHSELSFEQFPEVRRLQNLLSEDRAQTDFHDALDDLIARIRTYRDSFTRLSSDDDGR
jgi:TetR/AcrR family tetracycline transcriptional repressor